MNSTGYEGIGWIREGRRWGIWSLVPRERSRQGSVGQSGLAGALSRGFLGQVLGTAWELIARWASAWSSCFIFSPSVYCVCAFGSSYRASETTSLEVPLDFYVAQRGTWSPQALSRDILSCLKLSVSNISLAMRPCLIVSHPSSIPQNPAVPPDSQSLASRTCLSIVERFLCVGKLAAI